MAAVVIAAAGSSAPSFIQKFASWTTGAEDAASSSITSFTALIAGVFVLAVVLLIVPVVIRTFSLRRQCRALRKAIRETNTKLASRRRAIQDRLLRTRWSRPLWQTFFKTWGELFDKDDQVAAHPVRMVDFFPPDLVVPGIANRRLATVMPGILVALGILGTFLGLALGLPALERDIGKNPEKAISAPLEAGDQATEDGGALDQPSEGHSELAGPPQPRDGDSLRRGDSAIKKLISGLKLAFLTSLLGISGSLLFMFSDRIAINGLERTLRRTSRLAEQVFPFVSEHVVLARAERTQKEIHANLQTLGTDIATALSNTMGDAVGSAMAKHITPSIEKLEEVIGQLSNVVSTDMNSLLQNFNRDLAKSIEQRFGNFGESLTRMVESQESLHENVAGFSEQLRQQTATQQQLAEQINSAASSLHGVLDGLANITTQLDRAATRISSTSEALTASVNTALTSQQELIRVQEKLSQDLRQDLESLEETRTEVIDAWKAVSEEARGSIEVVQQSVRQLGEVVGDNLVKALDAFDAKLAEVIERFSGTLVETRETVNELPELVRGLGQNAQALSTAFEQVRERLQGVMIEIGQAVGESSSNTKEAVDQLGAVVQESIGVAGKFSEAIAEAKEFWASQQGQDAVEQRLGELVTLAAGSREELVAVRAGLSALSEMKDNVRTAREIAQQLQEKMGKALDGSLDQVVTRMEDLESVKNSLTAIAQNLDTVLPTVKEAGEKLRESSGGSFFKGLFGRK